MLDDAELADIFFLDADRGWAVGDRGVIWSTEDGGRHWRLGDSPVNCRLESVSFVDENQGWAVGGWCHPYTHRSSGVVIRTENGGRRWTALPLPTLPALKHVRFFDARRGWAVGNASAMYPSGVFRSDDGGRSWTAVSGGEARGWLGADFRDSEHGVVVGHGGEAGEVVQRNLRCGRVSANVWQPLRDVQLTGPWGWLVGDGGVVLQSDNAGAEWQVPPGPLPAAVQGNFDWRCVASFGPHCWIAGAPGTCVLYSGDRGQTWTVQRTNQNLPLRRLQFLDEQRGWAVGSLGTILATRDGGATWQRQKGQRTRAALLVFCSEPEHLPLELLTRFSGDEGYVGIAEILNHRDLEAPVLRESSWEERAHAAVVAAGGSQADATWRFPLRQAGLALPAETAIAGWNILHGGQATVLLEQHVVRCVRQWQPDVVVIGGPEQPMEEPSVPLVRQLVASAVVKAADPDAYADQLAATGLRPWKSTKVIATAGSDEGAIRLETTRLATHLGSSLADYAAIPRGLLRHQWSPTPVVQSYQVLSSEQPLSRASQDVFSGLVLSAGGESRRESLHQVATSVETLSKLAQKQRNLRALIARERQTSEGNVAWLAQVNDLTRELGPLAGGEVLFQLAEQYRAGGQPALAADALELLIERSPDHPLAEAALLWLLLSYASGEMDTYQRGETPRPGHYLATLGPVTSSDPADPGGLKRLAATRTDRAVALGQYIRQSRPTLFAEPLVQFALASAERHKSPDQSAALYEGLLRSSLTPDWRSCARGEQWLQDGRGASPKPTLECISAPKRPRLDGLLDEPLWEQAPAAQLSSTQQDDAAWPTTVQVAHDQQFLYLAVRSRKVPAFSYSSSTGTRARDADLRSHDHLEIQLDIDRDFSTCYTLCVDHRGWAGESCLGDRQWNPSWFVAAAQDDETWIVEAAIPLAELSRQFPAPREVWAISLQRIVPGIGVQGWTTVSSVSDVLPDEFGYLLFR